MKKETEEKINQLQNIEQNINTLIAQKQQFQSQNLEIENALSQIDKTERVFRIIGNIMVESTKEEAKNDLNEKKEVIELRLKTIEKQEEKLRQKATELQQEVLKEINN
ncbi:MAG: prefoldin subunit beta [Candidatus Woesearchaeota archaeon]